MTLSKKAITVPRTTRAQLLRDPNTLYVDDIRPDLKGWGLFFKENFFCSIDKRNKVKACTAYMLCYLTIGRKFNFTLMIIYRMEEVIKKRKGPMPFAMLLIRLFNHILETNPQAIDRPARHTFHECVMDPLDISRNLRPSFLEFYDELSDSEDLTKAQKEKRGMFKCLNRYVMDIDIFITMTRSSKTNSPNFKIKTARISVKYPNYVNLTSSSEEQLKEKTHSPPPRKKSLSPPQAPSKSISKKSTHYTSSSSQSESPTPTHVAPP
ncbi:hypothetical protein Tco_0463204 [Tanacetum coccineum]